MYRECKGNMNDNLDFRYGEGTSVSYGCGATLFGEFWYFGGSGKFRRQVQFKFM